MEVIMNVLAVLWLMILPMEVSLMILPMDVSLMILLQSWPPAAPVPCAGSVWRGNLWQQPDHRPGWHIRTHHRQCQEDSGHLHEIQVNTDTFKANFDKRLQIEIIPKRIVCGRRLLSDWFSSFVFYSFVKEQLHYAKVLDLFLLSYHLRTMCP